MEIIKTCCFTGHRPQNLTFRFNESHPDCIRLKARIFAEIEKLILQNGVSHFISGMALGVDTFCVEAVVNLKKKYPSIILEAAIPCLGQEIKWSTPAKLRYQELTALSDIRTVLATQYEPNCMQQRNKYMVDKSDYVLAVWDGRPSGTGNTIRYAEVSGKTIIRINPLDLLRAREA